MNFNIHHENWLLSQLKSRKGEGKRRLVEGHGYGEKLFLEKVWWPAVGSFEFLHAEYEVSDLRDGVRFLDFAYLRPPCRICIEIDGFATHARDIDRRRFIDGLKRQNHLIHDDWKVYRFAVDEIQEKPRSCQQEVMHILGRWYAGAGSRKHKYASPLEQIIHLATFAASPITPSEVAHKVGISSRYARELLHKLTEDEVLIPATGKQRTRSYRLNAKLPRGVFR